MFEIITTDTGKIKDTRHVIEVELNGLRYEGLRYNNMIYIPEIDKTLEVHGDEYLP